MLRRGEQLVKTECDQAISVGPRIAGAGHLAVISGVGQGLSLLWCGVVGATISRVTCGDFFAGVEWGVSLQGGWVGVRVETAGVWLGRG